MSKEPTPALFALARKRTPSRHQPKKEPVPFGLPEWVDPERVMQLCPVKRSKSGKSLWHKEGDFHSNGGWVRLYRKTIHDPMTERTTKVWVLSFDDRYEPELSYNDDLKVFEGFFYRLHLTVVKVGEDDYLALLSDRPIKRRTVNEHHDPEDVS
jgi:hypothetical protein